MGNSKIIVVSNQKGGVGKSTVCLSLANYLVEEGVKIGGIVDCDSQKSIFKKRSKDREDNKKQPHPVCLPYEVVCFDSSRYQAIPQLIENLRSTDMTYLIDTAGRIDESTASLLSLCDCIICPFNFDKMILESTTQFIMFWEDLKAKLQSQYKDEPTAELYTVLNMRDERIGTREQRVIFDKIIECYGKYSHYLGKIPYLAVMKECNSLELTRLQKSAVEIAYRRFFELNFKPAKKTGYVKYVEPEEDGTYDNEIDETDENEDMVIYP